MREDVTPLPPYTFMARCSVKAHGQLYLNIYTKNQFLYVADILHFLQNYTSRRQITKLIFI